MHYVYAAMWAAAGLILIFRMGKENRVFYGAGAFFLILGGWWLADAILPGNQFAGAAGWVLRAITAAALVLMCAALYRENRKTEQKAAESGASSEEEPK